MKRILLTLMMLSMMAMAVAQQPVANMPRDMRPYFVVFLVRIQKNPAAEAAVHNRYLAAHLAYLRRLVDQRKCVVAGPFLDQGRIAGMFIARAASAASARAMIEHDPMYQPNLFRIEVHPALLPSLAGVKIQY